ncbi:MAG: hypothetical protein HY537_01900, partial [Deltaproteobacteria bacterium]|nr:hypothetical protein [Deltaproteobacteria bacterium]
GQTVNFENLSAFVLTGGMIKNCIRDGAARAASRIGKKPPQVEQEDFLWAIKRELQKHKTELSRELVGEEYWKKVAPEWEYLRFGSGKNSNSDLEKPNSDPDVKT